MGVIPERKDYKNVSPETFSKFVAGVEYNKVCEKVSHVAPSDKSHFDRYGFASGNKRVSIVYDVKARMLSVTAFEDVMPRLAAEFDRASAPGKTAKPAAPAPKKQNEKSDKNQSAKKSEQKTAAKPDKQKKQPEKAAKPKPEPKKPEPKPDQKSAAKKQEVKKQETKSPEPQLGFVAPVVKATVPPPADDDNGNISLKKYTTERFDEVAARLKKDKKKYKLSAEEVADKGKSTELRTITVAGYGQKLKLRFMPKKQVLQLQGKHGALFTELQLLLSEQTDYRAAVDAHIEQNREDKKAGEVERQLKKMIPNAFPYLSKQSKIDFTIGVIELINSSEKHYDYSMLLLPPFRGLERLIFDLQRAQNIVVKMIGQAYEKEEGQYVLKASYRRKINSVVYAEVMADLYREYFATRNYYAHSDVTADGEVRIIDKKEQAAAIFAHMLEKVDYNCKKLREIGFSI